METRKILWSEEASLERRDSPRPFLFSFFSSPSPPLPYPHCVPSPTYTIKSTYLYVPYVGRKTSNAQVKEPSLIAVEHEKLTNSTKTLQPKSRVKVITTESSLLFHSRTICARSSVGGVRKVHGRFPRLATPIREGFAAALRRRPELGRGHLLLIFVLVFCRDVAAPATVPGTLSAHSQRPREREGWEAAWSVNIWIFNVRTRVLEEPPC